MKIAFCEIKDGEKDFFKKRLKGHDLVFFQEPLSESIAERIKDFDILSIFIYSKITPDVLSRFKNLKAIITRSMGFDHIDIISCSKKGIKVSTAPHYGDNSVAEHTFGLILSLSRNIHKAYLRTIHENYSIEGLEGFDLKGKTLGVIGAGRIGKNVIKIARGFDMKVLAVDHSKDAKLARKLGFEYTSLNNALKNSDIISLHVPYIEKNHHLINDKTIKLMKKNAILINTSRGPIVDTKALVKALEKNHLSGAGLDVLEGEELIKEEKELLHSQKKLDLRKMRQLAIDHELLHNEKVVFTPHIAFYSKEAVERIMESTLASIKGFINGKAVNLIGAR